MSRSGNMPHLTFRLMKCAALPKRPTTQKPFSLMAIFVTPSLTLCNWHMTWLFTATPPYIPTSKTANFTAYGKPFTLDDHRALAATLINAHRQHGTSSVISNSDTPETREIYSAFNLYTFSVRRSVSAKSRDMAGEVIGILRGDVGCNPGACGAWTSTTEHLRPAATWIGFDPAAGFDNGEPSDEHA